MLARVVEVSSGRAFDDYIKERIFEPLAMRDTCYPADLPGSAAQQLAAMYVRDDKNGALREDTRFDDYGKGKCACVRVCVCASKNEEEEEEAVETEEIDCDFFFFFFY